MTDGHRILLALKHKPTPRRAYWRGRMGRMEEPPSIRRRPSRAANALELKGKKWLAQAISIVHCSVHGRIDAVHRTTLLRFGLIFAALPQEPRKQKLATIATLYLIAPNP